MLRRSICGICAGVNSVGVVLRVLCWQNTIIMTERQSAAVLFVRSRSDHFSVTIIGMYRE